MLRFIVCVFVLSFTTLAYAESVGYVDMQKVYTGSEAGKRATREIQERVAPFVYQRDEAVTQARKAVGTKDERAKSDAAEAANQRVNDELKRQQDVTQTKLLDRVSGISAKLAVAKHYDVVKAESVLWAKIDLTKDVISKLDAEDVDAQAELAKAKAENKMLKDQLQKKDEPKKEEPKKEEKKK